MSKTNAERASDLIWRHWQAGTVIDDLPPDLKPANRTDGYAKYNCAQCQGISP